MGIKFSPKPLIDQAVDVTGLNDFNGRSFEEGLNALIHSLNHDLDMGELTAGYFQNVILGTLTNRLAVTQLIKDHPEIRDETIEDPIVIVGLPRSGTTLLHTLLALDPLSRYLRNFETFSTICPPAELIPGSVDPRIQECHDAMESFFAAAPSLRGINGLNFMASGTAECQNLMALEFVHLGWSVGASLFSYGNWVSACDMRPAYQWHKRLLKVLQWKLPNERWVLKAPLHLFNLDHLLETYPDAKIIFTHREPVAAMLSGISMACQWTAFSTQQVDTAAISDWYPALWAKGLERAIAIKDGMRDDQVFDADHQKLAEDPVRLVESIYDHFHIPFGRASKRRMQTWLRDNPRSKFGRHTYSSEELGIDPSQISKRFTFYQIG